MRKTIIATALIAICQLASATDRYFGDIETESPNGKYVITAKSPDNILKRPFASNFTIILTDTKSKKVLWQQKQVDKYTSPVELIPTDDGYVIMRRSGQDFCVFDRKGKLTKVVEVFKILSKDELRICCDNTTAGTFWRQLSKQGVTKIGDKSYFYVRTYWGRYIVIDYCAAKLVKDKKVLDKLEEKIVKDTKKLIRHFDGNHTETCERCSGTHLRDDLKSSAFIIRMHGIKEGEKLVNELVKRADDGEQYNVKEYLRRWDIINKVPGLARKRSVGKVETENEEKVDDKSE